ncbi:hypothetical protein BDN72DRAFT_462319 [Pluteus cervinus]|uniref:Uncharacterized protein n=1 Tax=Pluteus cervinus TaxID=181527 RepID=A0ACD3AZX3_9AGAR|nr:hypothetical protein BDN72DRAFT_462319 [Pluteus cervinus]
MTVFLVKADHFHLDQRRNEAATPTLGSVLGGNLTRKRPQSLQQLNGTGTSALSAEDGGNSSQSQAARNPILSLGMRTYPSACGCCHRGRWAQRSRFLRHTAFRYRYSAKLLRSL